MGSGEVSGMDCGIWIDRVEGILDLNIFLKIKIRCGDLIWAIEINSFILSYGLYFLVSYS